MTPEQKALAIANYMVEHERDAYYRVLLRMFGDTSFGEIEAAVDEAVGDIGPDCENSELRILSLCCECRAQWERDHHS
jgi:hypothetical protein